MLDGDRKFAVASAQVVYNTVETPERSFLEADIVDDPDKRAGENAWRVDLGTPIHDPDGITGVELHVVIGPDL